MAHFIRIAGWLGGTQVILGQMLESWGIHATINSWSVGTCCIQQGHDSEGQWTRYLAELFPSFRVYMYIYIYIYNMYVFRFRCIYIIYITYPVIFICIYIYMHMWYIHNVGRWYYYWNLILYPHETWPAPRVGAMSAHDSNFGSFTTIGSFEFIGLIRSCRSHPWGILFNTR